MRCWVLFFSSSIASWQVHHIVILAAILGFLPPPPTMEELRHLPLSGSSRQNFQTFNQKKKKHKLFAVQKTVQKTIKRGPPSIGYLAGARKELFQFPPFCSIMQTALQFTATLVTEFLILLANAATSNSENASFSLS